LKLISEATLGDKIGLIWKAVDTWRKRRLRNGSKEAVWLVFLASFLWVVKGRRELRVLSKGGEFEEKVKNFQQKKRGKEERKRKRIENAKKASNFVVQHHQYKH